MTRKSIATSCLVLTGILVATYVIYYNSHSQRLSRLENLGLEVTHHDLGKSVDIRKIDTRQPGMITRLEILEEIPTLEVVLYDDQLTHLLSNYNELPTSKSIPFLRIHKRGTSDFFQSFNSQENRNRLKRFFPVLEVLAFVEMHIDENLESMLKENIHLQKLYFRECSIDLSSEFRSQPSGLSEINIYDCDFPEQSSFKGIASIKSLKYLRIVNCNLTKLINHNVEISSSGITSITLDNCAGVTVATIPNLNSDANQLKWVSFSDCKSFDNQCLKRVSSWPIHDSLDLNGTAIDSLDSILNLEQLRTLNLRNTNITTDSIFELVIHPSLTYVHLDENLMNEDEIHELNSLMSCAGLPEMFFNYD